METIVFIGAGSMAEAVIAGIVEQGAIEPQNVFVMNKSDDERLISLQNQYGISIVCKEKEALKNADLVVLATKPKDIHQAMADIRPIWTKKQLFCPSLQAFRFRQSKMVLAQDLSHVPCQIHPLQSENLPLVSRWNHAIIEELKKHILGLLEAIGLVKEVEEDDLHAVTALSGSGPAYVYYLAEALEEAAIGKGLSKEVARALIIQTLEGAAAMMKETGTEPAELRKNVTSPSGTTEAGLNALESGSSKKRLGNVLKKQRRVPVS